MRHHLSVEQTWKGESRRSHGSDYTAAVHSTSSRMGDSRAPALRDVRDRSEQLAPPARAFAPLDFCQA